MILQTRPLIIAHRGFSSQYIENTLPAVQAAIGVGVDYVEIDVQQTLDGEIVVFHDYKLQRICGMTGRVRDKTRAELRKLKPRISTLAEVLESCKGKTRVLIEVKGADPTAVATIIQQTKMTNDVIVFSLTNKRMKIFEAVNPKIVRFGLIARNLTARINEIQASVLVEGLALSRRLVKSKSVVDDIHQRGWKLFVWTVNRTTEMKQLISWGVDGLITNYPDRAYDVL